jgi:hypothetical protein
LLCSLVSGASIAAVLLVRDQAGAQVREYKSGIVWPEPVVVTPGKDSSPPSDAVVLFDGKDLSKWTNGDKWIIKDGYAISAKTDIMTKDKFGDCQLHVEFATPAEVKGSGQGRGNSGVYLMNRYEVQILDSYENKTYFDGQCASLYKQHPPLVNACREPGKWQTYDIIFESPRFGTDGAVVGCRVIAQERSGSVVGSQDVTLPAAGSQVSRTITLRTRGRAVLGTVDSCVVVPG